MNINSLQQALRDKEIECERAEHHRALYLAEIEKSQQALRERDEARTALAGLRDNNERTKLWCADLQDQLTEAVALLRNAADLEASLEETQRSGESGRVGVAIMNLRSNARLWRSFLARVDGKDGHHA